ncbi:MAG: hypothetical protein AAF492_03205, partial [Verrucomicrobiota bacterium]
LRRSSSPSKIFRISSASSKFPLRIAASIFIDKPGLTQTQPEVIRKIFEGLEDLRNAHGPIPVLHHAVQATGIAQTGPHLPLLDTLDESLQQKIQTAAIALKDTPSYVT